jgi:catechol 2,3-dioxygenase-like lactoylglutathione lyase family enzyme
VNSTHSLNETRGDAVKVQFHYARFVVSDLEKSLRFYRDVLEMVEVQRVKFANPDIEEVILADRDDRPSVLLLCGEKAPVHSGMPTHGPVVLQVDDARVAAEEIKSAGYDLMIDPAIDLGPMLITMAVDPDGYHVEIFSQAADKTPMDFERELAQESIPHPCGHIHDMVLR